MYMYCIMFKTIKTNVLLKKTRTTEDTIGEKTKAQREIITAR